MIQANELRKDNWILYKEIPTIVFGVNGVDEKYLDPDGYIYDLKDCYRIPLTEKIVLSCGFQKSGFDFFLDQVYIHDHCGDDFYYKVNYSERPIAYVHELQNLFYALTGKELKVNL